VLIKASLVLAFCFLGSDSPCPFFFSASSYTFCHRDGHDLTETDYMSRKSGVFSELSIGKCPFCILLHPASV
ncbi:hypothetical protein, partial [Cronobacter sakazakii]|uniref:hypothetical protein n=1 Tax=Cronobacter sakazakii TaxID=28141 RepID=UPI0021171352